MSLDILWKKFEKIYPLYVEQFEEFSPVDNESITDKMNKVIQSLNRIGRLSESVVKDWNKVFEWLMNEGLADEVTKQMIKWKDDGTFETLLNSMFDTINEKVDGFQVQLDVHTSQLAEIAYNPIDYGCKFDGITDDSIKLQEFFDLSKVKGRVKFPNNGTLFITKPIYINKDNIEIDFNNVEIKWAGDTDLGTPAINRQIGAFNVIGTNTTIGDITSFTPKITTNEHAGKYYSKVTLASVSGVAIGDYVKVSLIQSATQTANALNPTLFVVTTVVDIVGNDIYLDYHSPFTFTAPYNFARLYKVTPRKNVILKNFNFNDTMPWTYIQDDATTIPADVTSKCVCPIYIARSVNVKVENVYQKYTKYPFMVDECKNVIIENLEVFRPTITAGGRGYGAQFINSTECEIRNALGNYARHVVDFSGSTFCKASKIKGRYMFAMSFMTHGAYEHDITFEDCEGATALGAGLSFGYVSYNVTYRNCKLNRVAFGYARNLKIYDSTVYFISSDALVDSAYPNGINAITEMTFKNCKVYFYTGHYSKLTRETNIFTFLELQDCQVEFLNTGTVSATQFFDSIDLVKFTNCKLNTEDNKTNTVARYISLNGCKSFVVNGKSVVTNTYFGYYSSSTIGDFECNDALLQYTSGVTGVESFINDNYGTVKRTIRLSKIKLDYTASVNLRLIRVGGTPSSTVYIRSIITENDINSLSTGKVSLYPPRNGVSNGVPMNTIISNNILLNSVQEGFATTEFPNNLWA